ncbi:MAG: peptide chain release factor N(5)-glutamine methyltransferase [Puniceicoccales bacterium]|jgi:release factor glutamine methyltransferase|nr:peptide chain release factor N(5)-glutamine methyltransferase [Puniceicoccales bacterium]
MVGRIELLQRAIAFLHSKNIEQAKCDGECLLAHVLSCSRSVLYLDRRATIDGESEAHFQKLLLRRSRREPLQYILGEVDFCDVRLDVDSRVLIPRSETELLVEWLVAYVKKYFPNIYFKGGETMATPEFRILDLGTGSGAIAIALAKYFPKSRIIAVDRSPMALEVARENMQKNRIQNLQLLESDWYAALEAHPNEKKFDIIVSNPPYLTQREFDGAQDEIRKYEPIGALIAGNDGLRDVDIILSGAPKFLKKGGIVAIETGILHPKQLREKYKNTFQCTEILKDLNQFDRFFITHS